jgi:putative phosphoesterase
MILGVISDSHDNLPMLRRAVEVFQASRAERLLHAGDFIAPFAVRELLKFPGPVHGCFGNNDGERAGIRKVWPNVAEPPLALQLGGRRILLTHAPGEVPAGPERPEIVIFGHTHQIVVERPEGGPLRLNPGEAGGWLTGRATIALLDTDTLDVKIVDL